MNRRTFPIAVIIFSSIFILALFVFPALAQGDGFTESFDDPQLTGWEHSPEVIVSEGVLRIAPGNFAAHMGPAGDFDLSLRLRFDGQGETEVQYFATDSGSYLLIFTPDRLMLLIPGEPGSEPTELAGADMGQITTEGWLTLRILLANGQHTVLLNEATVLSAQDSTLPPGGGLVLASHGERTTEVDDISLSVTPAEAGIGELQPEPSETSTPATAATESDTWQSLFASLTTSQRAQSSTFDIGTFAVNLVLAAIASFILSRIYVFWGASLSNRRKFAANFMLVTVTTTFIILVVRSSVALSLGLVGALSIIRFRAAIKEPEELAYLFFAISLGIGLGDNQRMVTLLTLVVVIIIVGLARLLRQSQADVNMNMSISSRKPNKIEMTQIMQALEQHCSQLRLLRYDENDEALEMSFVVEFRHTSDLDQARASLLTLSDNLEISFMDNRGIW